MEISIATKSGKSFPLKVESDDSIENVLIKIDIKEAGNLPIGPRRLVHNQRKLEAEFTLKHYSIKDGDVLFLVITSPKPPMMTTTRGFGVFSFPSDF